MVLKENLNALSSFLHFELSTHLSIYDISNCLKQLSPIDISIVNLNKRKD